MVADNAFVAAMEEGKQVVEIWDQFCQDGVCKIVVGGVRVYKDSSHFTGTNGVLLVSYLEKKILSSDID